MVSINSSGVCSALQLAAHVHGTGIHLRNNSHTHVHVKSLRRWLHVKAQGPYWAKAPEFWVAMATRGFAGRRKYYDASSPAPRRVVTKTPEQLTSPPTRYSRTKIGAS
jgi:hypothetical protein